MRTSRFASLIAPLVFVACSTTSPDATVSETAETTASTPTASETTNPETTAQVVRGQDELALSSETETLIVDWYEDEDHKGERRILTLNRGDASLIEATERRYVSRKGREECLEGELYLHISAANEVSPRRWGHDCCPGTQCQPEMETFMVRLFAHIEADDLQGIAALIHPTEGIQISQEYLDREEPQQASRNEEHLSSEAFLDGVPSDVFVCPADHSNAIMDCHATSEQTHGALPSTFSCSCRAGGDVSEFTWTVEDQNAYLTAFDQTWQN